MRRTIGNVLFYGGLLVVVLAWFFHNRPPVTVAGHTMSVWVVGAVVGFVLALIGIFAAGPSKKK